ncbi:hypothetical protein GJU39_09450 [Pedobacter petrophilus]|uniref:UBP-type domain-containing protein n=1 Tax=Pedobacter petrophilus TaxID=1908241 RepID=A0A7K0FZ00_9SPHI|nr:UBP-type zinc finger domain-containing protein [Pedobacter petrophilus]MRX76314.1 hypothetical protein [Pedobacter petrophilus]
MGNSEICIHLKAVKVLKTASEHVCEACIKLGTKWVHLRTCQTCGVTLCCDSSPMQHMSHHCRAEKHPVVISSEPGERWLYCYLDDEMVGY